MPNAPIPFTNLPSATLLSGDELVPIVQGGTNKTATVQQLALGSGLSSLIVDYLTVITSATIEALTVSSNFSAQNGNMDTLIVNNLGVLSTATIEALSVSSNFSVLNASASFLDVWSSATIEALTVSSNFSTLNASIGSLSVSSNLAVTNLTVSGSATFGSSVSVGVLNVSGSATFASSVRIGTLVVSGSAVFSSSVSVGVLTVSSSATFSSSASFNTLTASGSAVFASSVTAGVLTVSGSATFSSSVTINTLTVSGSATFSSSVSIFSASADTLAVSSRARAGDFSLSSDGYAYVSQYSLGPKSVNFNSVADTQFPITLPSGHTRYQFVISKIYNASISLAGSSFAVYTGSSASGTALIVPTAVTVTSTAPSAANNFQQAAGISAWSSATPLYFRVTVAGGSAATADVELIVSPL